MKRGIFANPGKGEISIKFKQVELDNEFTKINGIVEDRIKVGIGVLGNGNLSQRFEEKVFPEMDLQTTVGIEIGSNIILQTTDDFKCVCLKAYQEYWDPKDPDNLSIKTLSELIITPSLDKNELNQK